MEAAAHYVEPIDVRNNEYVAYDGSGRLLQLVPTKPVVTISGHVPGPSHDEQLELSLRSFLSSIGIQAPPPSTSLDALLAYCVRVFGYTS